MTIDRRKFARTVRRMAIFAALLLAASARAQNRVEPNGAGSSIPDWQMRASFLAGREISLNFKGRVTDQNGDPVEGAKITIHIDRSSPSPPGMAQAELLETTDKAGNFSVIGERAYRLIVNKIEKKGYEYLVLKNPQISFEVGSMDHEFPKDDQVAKFFMRKRENGTFLIHESNPSFRLQVLAKDLQKTSEGMSQVVGFDLIRGFFLKDINRKLVENEPVHLDLLMGATFDQTGTTWTVVLTPADPSGGIIASNEMLYEAPSEGYSSKIVFEFDGPKVPQAKYLYLRSRDPAICTRIDIESVNANDRLVSINGTRATNPYGDRSLDDDPEIPAIVRLRLKDEVLKAFRQNQRPPRPDVSALIQAEKLAPTTMRGR